MKDDIALIVSNKDIKKIRELFNENYPIDMALSIVHSVFLITEKLGAVHWHKQLNVLPLIKIHVRRSTIGAFSLSILGNTAIVSIAVLSFNE